MISFQIFDLYDQGKKGVLGKEEVYMYIIHFHFNLAAQLLISLTKKYPNNIFCSTLFQAGTDGNGLGPTDGRGGHQTGGCK